MAGMKTRDVILALVIVAGFIVFEVGAEWTSGAGGGAVIGPHPSGSVTIVSQKVSIDRTTVMNWSRSTGLVM